MLVFKIDAYVDVLAQILLNSVMKYASTVVTLL